MTSKERSKLMSLAQTLEPVVQVGRSGLSPEIVISADEALAKRELIKINIQKNCLEDHKEVAQTLAERPIPSWCRSSETRSSCTVLPRR